MQAVSGRLYHCAQQSLPAALVSAATHNYAAAANVAEQPSRLCRMQHTAQQAGQDVDSRQNGEWLRFLNVHVKPLKCIRHCTRQQTALPCTYLIHRNQGKDVASCSIKGVLAQAYANFAEHSDIW